VDNQKYKTPYNFPLLILFILILPFVFSQWTYEDVYREGVAYGTERISVEEYYKRGELWEEVCEKARKGKFKVIIKGLHPGFLNYRWNELYFKDPSEIKEILREDDTFNFKNFDNFYNKNGSDYEAVTVHDGGYLVINHEEGLHKLVIPISQNSVDSLKKIE